MKQETLVWIALIASIVAIIGTFTSIYTTFNEIPQIVAQIEDVKHENILTRLNNARTILYYCDLSFEEMDRIDTVLFDGIKKATLLTDFEGANSALDSVKDDLMKCKPVNLRVGFAATVVPPIPAEPIPSSGNLNSTESKP